MNSKSWLLLDTALLIAAGMSVTNTLELPAQIRKQQADNAKVINQPATVQQTAAHKSATRTTKAGIKAKNTAGTASSYWPAIRRGSLATIWKNSLFSKDRTEMTAEMPFDSEQQDDALPAPPNFELIGILTVNESKVAIIELKNSVRQTPQPMRRGPGGRMPMPPQQPVPEASSSNAFEPTFVTAHESELLRGTEFTLATINSEEKYVLLEKAGLEYKLSLEGNTQQAQQRIANQTTFEQTQKDKSIAAAQNAQQQAKATQNQPNQQQNAPNPGNMPGTPGNMPPGMRGNMPPGMRGNMPPGQGPQMNNGNFQRRGPMNNGNFQGRGTTNSNGAPMQRQYTRPTIRNVGGSSFR